MNIKKILIPLMALLIAVPGLANEKMKYKNPTGKEFPILAWYSVLGNSTIRRNATKSCARQDSTYHSPTSAQQPNLKKDWQHAKARE